jgi:protoporphyrinogen oxidase
MVDVVDVHTRQRVVAEFLTAEGSMLIRIHRHLRSMYGENATDISCEMLGPSFYEQQKDIGIKAHSDQPPTAKTMETRDKVAVLIWDNYHITTSELCATIETGKPDVTAITRELGYRKVCAR